MLNFGVYFPWGLNDNQKDEIVTQEVRLQSESDAASAMADRRVLFETRAVVVPVADRPRLPVVPVLHLLRPRRPAVRKRQGFRREATRLLRRSFLRVQRCPGKIGAGLRYFETDLEFFESHAALIDFHSGMGPYGYGMPIAPCRPGDAAHERASAWYGESLMSMHALDKPDADTDSDALVGGAMIEAFANCLPDTVTTAIALEFGTYPFDDCIPAMRADAWLHGFGQPDSALGRRIGRDWLEKFFPEDDDWMHSLHWRSSQVIGQAVRGLASL